MVASQHHLLEIFAQVNDTAILLIPSQQSLLLGHLLLNVDSTCTTHSEREASRSRYGRHDRVCACCRERATG